MFLNRKTILYFIPHPREELEIMGADIRHNLSRGHRIHMILCTFDGENSAETTPQETAFRKSCQALGIKEANIHLPKSREPAGSLTVAYAERLIKNHLILWDRSAIVCVPSQHNGPEQHPDNKNLGKAAENQLKRGLIGQLRLFVEPKHYDTVRHNPYLIPVEPYERRPKENARIEKAMEAYSQGKPELQDICSRYYLLHNPKTETKRQKTEYQRQRWLKLENQQLVCFSENQLKRGLIGQLRLFVEPKHYDTVRHNPYLIPVEPYERRPKENARIEKAMEAYSQGKPELQDICSRYYLLHNPKTETKRQKTEYQRQRWLKLENQQLVCFSSPRGPKPDLGAWQLVSVQPGRTEDYREFCENYQVPFQERNLQRIADGASFWCLVSRENGVAASCWVAYRQPFYMGETDQGFHMGQSTTGLLFALATAPQFREQEPETLLLKAIVSHASQPERFLMYTSPDNEAARRKIREAGFACDGVLKARDGSLSGYLQKEGFVELYRKYQNEGKTVLP